MLSTVRCPRLRPGFLGGKPAGRSVWVNPGQRQNRREPRAPSMRAYCTVSVILVVFAMEPADIEIV